MLELHIPDTAQTNFNCSAALQHGIKIEEIDEDILAAIRAGKSRFILQPQDRLFMLIRALRADDYY